MGSSTLRNYLASVAFLVMPIFGQQYSMKLAIKFEKDFSSWQSGYLISYNGQDFYLTSEDNSDCVLK